MYTVEFAENRSERGAVASFRFKYEADRFIALLAAQGWWVLKQY